MNKKQEAIAKLQQKIQKPIVRWILLGQGMLFFGLMMAPVNHGNALLLSVYAVTASVSVFGFLVLTLQTVFIKPILEILQDSLEDEDDE